MVLLHQGRKNRGDKGKGEHFSLSLSLSSKEKKELTLEKKKSQFVPDSVSSLALNFTVGETERETHFMALKQYSRSFLNREVILDKIVPKRFRNRIERERKLFSPLIVNG